MPPPPPRQGRAAARDQRALARLVASRCAAAHAYAIALGFWCAGRWALSERPDAGGRDARRRPDGLGLTRAPPVLAASPAAAPAAATVVPPVYARSFSRRARRCSARSWGESGSAAAAVAATLLLLLLLLLLLRVERGLRARRVLAAHEARARVVALLQRRRLPWLPREQQLECRLALELARRHELVDHVATLERGEVGFLAGRQPHRRHADRRARSHRARAARRLGRVRAAAEWRARWRREVAQYGHADVHRGGARRCSGAFARSISASGAVHAHELARRAREGEEQ